MFKPGQKSNFSIVAYEGLDYHVSVCNHKKLGKVIFNIIEDNNNKDILYSNSDTDSKPEVIFNVETTRKLIVEVVTPQPQKKNDKTYCLGVLIEHKKVKKTGF